MLVFKSTILLVFLSIFTAVLAKTVTHDWNITWATANPDGMFDRRVYSINGQWPVPILEVDIGDRVIINMENGLGDRDTSLHFHGLFQNGTVEMDGPAFVTQCPVAPGQRITYNFTVDQPGTYWYHDHNKGQYPDGLRGPLIVHDKNDPHKDLYDGEIILSMSDWYHEQMPVLVKKFLSPLDPTGAEPVPQSALLNDSQNITLKIEPGKTYLVRMVNMAAFAAQYIWFEEHTFRVVEVDGVYTEPYETNMLYLTAAQRASVLLTTKNDISKNYAFVGSMDQDLFDTIPQGLNPNVTGWLVYNDNEPKPKPKLIDTFEPLDDFLLKPVDGLALLPCPDMSITLNLTMDTLSDDINYAFFNNITYSRPLVPTLYTALTTGSLATNPTVYGVNTNPFVLPHNKVIEIIVNNHDPGKHPFHLHGHNFQVTHRSKENAGSFNPVTADKPPLVPMRRDVVLAPPSGNVVLRFFADNPGVWLFHCHIEWHLISGLVATMIEAPLELQGHITIPPDHLAVCKYKGIPIEGDSMGNPIEGDSIGNTNGLLGLPGPDVSPKQPPAEPAVFPHIMELGAKVIELTQLMKELLGMYGVNFNPSTWQLS